MINTARLIGPVVAGVLVGLFGEGLCFAIDAVSYLAVIASLLMMRVEKRPLRPRAGRFITELTHGIRYVWSLPLVRTVLILLAISSMLGGAYTALLPVVAAATLHGGPHTLSALMAAAGCGALASALYLAGRSSVAGVPTLIACCMLGLGASLIALELATALWIAIPLSFVIGSALVMQAAATNALLQTLVDDKLLGRVISLHAVALIGGTPVGALLEGAVANRIGAIHTFAIAGALCIATGTAFSLALPRLRQVSRPLYARLGLSND
jgi:hypothetical protein